VSCFATRALRTYYEISENATRHSLCERFVLFLTGPNKYHAAGTLRTLQWRCCSKDTPPLGLWKRDLIHKTGSA